MIYQPTLMDQIWTIFKQKQKQKTSALIFMMFKITNNFLLSLAFKHANLESIYRISRDFSARLILA